MVTNKQWIWIAFWLSLKTSLLIGQDLSGHWEGYLSQTVNGQKEQLHFELQLTPRGNHFSGAAMVARNDTTTCTTLVRSIWNDGFLYYKDLKFIKIRGDILSENWCLKECTFSYHVKDGDAWLIGHWTGNTSLEQRCQPGIIKLSRKKLVSPTDSTQAALSKPQEVTFYAANTQQQQIDATIELSGIQHDYQKRINTSTRETKALLTPGKYEVWVNSPGYHQIVQEKVVSEEALLWEFLLSPIKKGDKFVIKGLYFEQSQAIFAEASKKALHRLLLFLQENPQISISIVGHTDNIGNSYLNKILSLNRARAVARYLVDQGIVAERVRTDGLGGEQAISSNGTEEGRALNRRVEVEIISTND